jgi:hypothetical protein
MYEKSVLVVRWLLGIQYLLSGLNWWYKILPFPSLHDPAGMPMKQAVVGAMIATGWMFYLAKVVELTAGLSLLFNRYVPLMLVASMSVAVLTFLLDAMNYQPIVGWIAGTVSSRAAFACFLDMIFFGGAVLSMQIYLMIAYLHHYKPMLVAKADVRMPA